MSKLTAEEKLTKARTALVLAHPFFATLAMRLKFVEDSGPNNPTMCTDGRNIYWNRKFVEELSGPELQGVVAHEALHPGCLHHLRRGNRDHNKWNKAADYAINPIVLEAGMFLPDDCLINQAWAGKSAEEIYTLLPDEDGDGQGGSGSGWNIGGFRDPGDGGDGQGGLTAEQLAEAEADWKQAMAQAAHMAKMQGKLPASMQRLVDDTLSAETPWQDVLWSYLTERRPDEVTFNRPNRRFISRGIYLPSVTYTPTGELAVMIDTSGSVGEHELNMFGAEVNGIHHQIKPTRTIVIYCDAAVNRVDYFETDDDIKLYAVGGGGTDFNPPFDWLEQQGITPNAAVYLTDGYGDFPEEQDFPVVWAINNKNVEPPFGRVVRIPPP